MGTSDFDTVLMTQYGLNVGHSDFNTLIILNMVSILVGFPSANHSDCDTLIILFTTLVHCIIRQWKFLSITSLEMLSLFGIMWSSPIKGTICSWSIIMPKTCTSLKIIYQVWHGERQTTKDKWQTTKRTNKVTWLDLYLTWLVLELYIFNF